MSSIVLWVSDLQAQEDFYSRLFGVPVVGSTNGFVEVSDGKNSVLLHQLETEYQVPTPLTQKLEAISEAAIKPIFTVASIKESKARTSETFATFATDSLTHGEFIYVDITDPEGNVIQIRENKS